MSALFLLALRLYRRHWKRLLFFSSCAASGVCFLVGVGSLLSSVESAVAARARELMAADLELSSQRPFGANALAALRKLSDEGHRVAETISFSSMLAPRSGDPFLVGVKAVAQAYPFYGRLETRPPDARPAGLGCLLDESAAVQHGLGVGDRVRLGELELTVTGLIVKEPDRTMAGFNLAPRLLVALESAEGSGLMRFGSRIRHARLIALASGAEPPSRASGLKRRLERELEDPYVSISAYTDAEPSVRETLERVGTFFVFLSLVALLLGALGMAASVATFLNDEVETAGTLRCLGLSPRQIGAVYGLLALAVGAQGGLLGALGGWALGGAFLAPAARWLQLTIPVTARLDGRLMAEGFALCCALALGLTAASVAALARVSPMEALRERAARLAPSRGARAAVGALGLTALFLYAFAKSNSWLSAGAFAVSLGVASAAAAGLILLSLQALAWAPLHRLGLAARHGVLALTRHRGRSLILLFTLSLGLSLLGALGVVHRSLRSEILIGRSRSAPDHFLVDIQKSQLSGVREILARHVSVEAEPAALIRARLSSINGAPVARRDVSGMTVEQRARQRFLTREYNLTYKDRLQDSERLVAGEFWAPGETRALISLEQSFARRVGVGLGDRLSFDVQGRPVEGVVSSIRKIEWLSMRPNFFVVFPQRVLEPAPQTFVTSARVADLQRASSLRRELARAYPNVSVIDLSRVLDNVQSVLGALIGALNVLAAFCLAVGLLVLAGTLALGRRERLREAALYRALGFSARELLRMDACEFAALGLVAFLIAAADSHLLGWAIARQMKIGFAPDPGALVWMGAAALLLPLGVGLAVHRRAYRSEILAELRDER